MTTGWFGGTARLCITPPLGMAMSGFAARQGGAVGVHDHLWARALALSATETGDPIILVAVDTIGVDRALVDDAARRLAQLGLPGAELVVAATHTHGGPAVLPRGYLGEPDPAYRWHLAAQIAGAAWLAARQRRSVRLSLGVAEERGVAKNRRVEGGPIDPTLTVLRMEPAGAPGGGEGRAALINYACHPTVVGPQNRLFTGDYPAFLTAALEAVYQPLNAIFTNGLAGQLNVGHRAADSMSGRGWEQRGFPQAAHYGRRLAAAAIQAFESARPLGGNTLRILRQPVALPLAEPPPREELERWARTGPGQGVGGSGDGPVASAVRRWASAVLREMEEGALPREVPVEVAAINVGGALLLCFPGEVFTEFGLELRRELAGVPLVPIGYAGDNPGYIPHPSAYTEGGYEVEEAYRFYGWPSVFAPQAGPMLAETALQLARRIIS